MVRSRGFTLIELLVCIGIISILSAISFPIFAQAKSKARSAQCSTQLRQLNMALTLYADDADGMCAPSYTYSNPGYSEFAWDFATRWDQTIELGFLGPYVKTGKLHRCPQFHGNAWGRPFSGYGYNTTYLGGDEFDGTFPANLTSVAEPSGTVSFADCGFGSPAQGANFLRAPSDPLFVAGKVHFRHQGRAMVAWLDGHVTSAPIRRTNPREPEMGAISDHDEAYDLQ